MSPVPARFAEERQQQIAVRLRAQGRVEVGALAVEHGVSEDTIRRDLRALAARGLVQKTHGGAVAVHVQALGALDRAEVLPGPKQAIAQAAAARVEPHQCLFIDAGTTNLALARLLRDREALRPLTVVTHAWDVAQQLIDDPGITLVMAGGRWSPTVRGFLGPQAEATLRAHRADLAFLGTCALHPRTGLTSTDPDDARIKRAMIDSAARRVLLGDASKLERVAPHAVAPLEELDALITDTAVPWLEGRLTVDLAPALAD